MKSTLLVRATLLSIAFSIGLTGCSDEGDMSQDEIQYLSHLDQSRFFQRQGELKASTLEARSAIEIQPQKAEPYFVIIDNLLTAGDALNAERQLDRVMTDIPKESLTPSLHNKAALIRAEAQLMQREFAEALASLDGISSPDRAQELEAALLRGRIFLADDKLDDAEKAFQSAKALDTSSALPMVGLSRVAYARGDKEQIQALIQEAEQVDSNDPELWLWKAQLAHANKEWKTAEEAYIRALEDIGQYDVMTYRKYETISALISTLRAQNKSSEAFVYEEILAKSAPGTIKSNLAAASKAFRQGDLDAASRYLEEILAQAPDHEQSALMLGMVRFRQGRTREAEALLAPIAEMGDSEAANKLLAATRIQLRDPEGARKILEKLDDNQKDPEVLALVGIASLASGDAKSGMGFIERSLEIRPDNHELRLRYAGYLLQQGDIEGALHHAEQVMDVNQTANQARILMIQAHIVNNDMNSAKESANAWVKEQPENINALIARGQLAARAGDSKEAMNYFDQAAKKDPGSPSPAIAAGNLALELKQLDAARTHFQRAVKLAPDNRQALKGVSDVMERGQLVSYMRTVLEENPEANGPKAILLEVALRDDNASEADELSAALLERESENKPSRAAPLVAGIYHGVAVSLEEAGKPQQARKVLNRGRVLFPENQDIALQSAALAFRNNQGGEAREILQEVKRVHPDSPRPYLVEATHLANQQKHKEAAEMFQLALAKERTAPTELAYARELQRSGQARKAIESLESAVKDYPNQPQLMLSLALYYQENNQESEARQTYERVLKVSRDNVLALNNLAWLYHQNGDQRALNLARRAYELSPDSGAIADTYGWILFNSGKHEESLPVLEKAYELEPEAEEIAMHLVEAYKATGQGSKAKTLLEKM